ncbi:MAG: CBS domain-containing protein [bacterium]
MPNFPDITPGPLSKGDLLKLFYRYSLQIIPVVDDDKRIIGFLRKSDLIAASGIVKDLNSPVDELIRVNLSQIKPQEDLDQLTDAIQNFKRIESLPVINQEGKIIDAWDKIDLMLAWAGKYDRSLKEKSEGGVADTMVGITSLPEYLSKVERDLILKSIKIHKGVITKAAKALGISTASIRYRIKKLKINI